MRRLGLIICGLLLAACTETTPEGLTAADALGDLRTIDYCTLVDTAGEKPVSSFEHCRVEATAEVRMLVVGPIRAGVDPATEPYDYPGDLPPGVRVVNSKRTPGDACTRWLGFADDKWLQVFARPTGEKPCDRADDVIGDVLTAIKDRKVGHTTYGPDSFGALKACDFLDRPEVGEIAGRGELTRPPHEHDCSYRHVGLEFSIDDPDQGVTETFGGRSAMVRVNSLYCDVFVERPLTDRPGLVERARVYAMAVDTNGPGDGADVCDDARAVAELVIPELPQ